MSEMPRCTHCGGSTYIDEDIEAVRGWLTLKCLSCGREYPRKVRTTELEAERPPAPAPPEPAREHAERLQWEVFDAGRSVATLTITKYGHITLSRGAVDLLGGAEEVELLFERRRRLIGIRPASGPHTLRIGRGKGSDHTGATLYAVVFSRHYGLVPTKAKKMRVEQRDGMLVAALDQADDGRAATG